MDKQNLQLIMKQDLIKQQEEHLQIQTQREEHKNFIENKVNEFINSLSKEEFQERKKTARNKYIQNVPMARNWDIDTLDKTIFRSIKEEIAEELSLPKFEDWLKSEK